MSLHDIQAAREARKTALRQAYERQAEIDYQALNDAELEYGDNRVCYIEVPYVEGYPTLAIARAPDKAAIKRYRGLCQRAQNGKRTDQQAILEATQQVARVSVVYPSTESHDDAPSEWDRMCDQWQALEGQLGARAVELHAGVERDEGNG